MHRGLGVGARAASQHLDCFLFLVLKVVSFPPSREFCEVCIFLLEASPSTPLDDRVFALGYRGEVHP